LAVSPLSLASSASWRFFCLPSRGPTALALSLVLVACQGRAAEASDETTLRSLLQRDTAISARLHDVDELTARGKAKEALAALHDRARPLAEESVARTREASFRSGWGKARAEEMKALARDRLDAIGTYEAALESDDVERVIATLDSQKDLERRALALSSAAAAPPSSGCSTAGPGR
jgi:hypothetical protein